MSKLKNLTILGILAYILSLPIIFWKSSKLGKLFFIFFLIGLIGYGITTFYNTGFEAYYKIKSKLEYNTIKTKLNKVETKISSFDKTFDEIERNLKNTAKEKLFETLSYKIDKLNSLDERIKSINNSLDVIYEEQRKSLKERLIVLREKVKEDKASINKVEIRKELELIASNIQLLTYEEKQRLYNDLDTSLKVIKDDFLMVTGQTVWIKY